MRSLVIDSQAEIGTGETWNDPPRVVDYKFETLWERSAEAGIDRSCVSVPRNPTYGSANQALAKLCEKHPEQLIGFAVHSPMRETGQIRQMLIEEVKSMGLKGVRCDGHPTRELLDAAAELEIPVIYYPDPRDIPGGPLPAYFMPASAYPSVRFIMPHLGSYRTQVWWAPIAAIDVAKRFPNVYLGTSGCISVKYLEMAARELPPEKLLFGSSAPELDPRVEIQAVKLLKLEGSAQDFVLGGNVRRLLGL
jgi:predicted TIM-barrel fold metal-dependent hydrolase